MECRELRGPESGPQSRELDSPALAGRLGVIADLLADLPQAERQEVIATLAPADRVAIAKELISGNGEA